MSMRKSGREDCISQKAERIYSGLRRLWAEYAFWTRSFALSAAFELADLPAVSGRLMRSPSDFANLLRPFYGNTMARRFEELFSGHLDIAVRLFMASKAGDMPAADELRRSWQSNADALAAYLADISSNRDGRVWRGLLGEHLAAIEKEVSLILGDNYAQSVALFDDIEIQALHMGDEMAVGLIRRFKI